MTINSNVTFAYGGLAPIGDVETAEIEDGKNDMQINWARVLE